MISYRSHTAYEEKFGRRRVNVDGSDPVNTQPADSAEMASMLDAPFSVETYLQYQGEKFYNRFDANSYITLTRLMDTHDIGRDRGGIAKAAAMCKQPVHVVGIDSDILYPISEQEELAEVLPNSQLSIVRSDDGHDGFLLAQESIGPIITKFLEEV